MNVPARKEAEVATTSEGAAVLALIERAARDQSVDIDKMERLMKMHTETVMRSREDTFNLAMQRAQEKMRPVLKDAINPSTHSKYASYAALDSVIRPIYTAEGFALSFDEGETTKSDHIRVLCYVSCSGYTRTYHVDMPADGKGAKGGEVMTKTHAAGSAFSYGQRYLLKLIFNLATVDREDDGNAAGTVTINEEQLTQLQLLISDIGGENFKALEKGLLTYKKIGELSQLPASQFQDAVDALEAKRGKPLVPAKRKRS